MSLIKMGMSRVVSSKLLRRVEVRPENGLAYVRVLNSVWYGLEAAEYVGRIIDNAVGGDEGFVARYGEASRRQWRL
jgi:hypothetical protein